MRVVAVQYLNTLPLIYGIRSVANSELQSALLLATPASCARAAIEGKCDIALVPVGALEELNRAQPQSKIITSYCISATGAVDTVALLSNHEITDIGTIYLDTHSRTSVELIKVLCRDLWKISPLFVDGIPENYQLSSGEAMVVIGDKVFDVESSFSKKYDLSEAWQQLTSLPFVFAVWVAITPSGLALESELNRLFSIGVKNIERALPDDSLRPRRLHYLTHSIEYEMSDLKRRAMQLFSQLRETLK